jgi:hypothetical protein
MVTTTTAHLPQKNTIRPWSTSPPQEIITSLWQLPNYGYDQPYNSQETLSSDSSDLSDLSDSSVSAVYGDESSIISIYDEGSIYPQDAIELEDSTDSGSINSCTSSTRATPGSLRAMSSLASDGVSNQATHNMNTLQRHRVACQNDKPAKSLSSHPVIISESSSNRPTQKGMSETLPYSSTASPLGHGTVYSSSPFHEVANSPVHASANGQLDEARSCCIGVLSAFEERHLGEEDKEAILHGGCHGLCDSQLSTMANRPGDETGSRNSSPCVRSPNEKRARFGSPMPSSMIAPIRSGTSPTQPRFPHRRVAAQYKQPCQPLPLDERPVRRVRFASAPTPAQPEIRKINEHFTALSSCLKVTPGQTTMPGSASSKYNTINSPTRIQAKQDHKRQKDASEQKTGASNGHDKDSCSRGRKLWGRISALF